MPAIKFWGLLLLSNLCGLPAQAASDTVSIYFPFNKYTLTEAARQKLDAAIYNGTITETQPVQIIGFTDQVGGNSYNLRLSKQRAVTLKAYLIRSGFNPGHIIMIMGKGEEGARTAAGPDGNQADRRVDIVKGTLTAGTTPTNPAEAAPVAVSAPQRMASTTDIGTVAAGEALVLDKIYFYPGRHIVRKESDEALDALFDALQANPKVRISIEGHVCCIYGSAVDAVDEDTHRQDLSVNRARAIRDYLIERGIAAKRLEYSGFGHRRPVVMPETTEEIADKNRRVEIRVIK